MCKIALSAATPIRWLPSQPMVTVGLSALVPVGTCKPGVASPSFHSVAAQSITAGPNPPGQFFVL